MKLTALFSVLLLTAVFVFGPNDLEAKHRNHFSINFGPVISAPAYPGYVVGYPAYVQDRVIVNPYGYPAYREQVYVQPAPVYYAPRPAIYSGFSWGFNIF